MTNRLSCTCTLCVYWFDAPPHTHTHILSHITTKSFMKAWYVCAGVCICVHVCLCMCMCMVYVVCGGVCVRLHTCTCMHICMYMYMYMCVCQHAVVCVCVRVDVWGVHVYVWHSYGCTIHVCSCTCMFVQFLKDEFIEYLERWRKSVVARPGEERKCMMLSQETLTGLKITGIWCTM